MTVFLLNALAKFLIALIFITPFLAYFLARKYRIHLALVFLLACVVVYGLVVGGALATDAHLQALLASYDLNNDGFFDGDEITPEQEKVMQAVVSDTGRRMAVVTGLIVAPILVSGCFLGCAILMRIVKWIIPHRTS
ncbi:Uncharacterised protein [Moraxella caviae]|nr:Uncharacterised protein [Moraxella caviae]VEW10568.1 Uncharacterised protein [Moraxella caviae]